MSYLGRGLSVLFHRDAAVERRALCRGLCIGSTIEPCLLGLFILLFLAKICVCASFPHENLLNSSRLK